MELESGTPFTLSKLISFRTRALPLPHTFLLPLCKLVRKKIETSIVASALDVYLE